MLFTTIDKVKPGDIIHVRNDVITIKVNEVSFDYISEFYKKGTPVYKLKGIRYDPTYESDSEGNSLYRENEIETTIDTSVVLLLIQTNQQTTENQI